MASKYDDERFYFSTESHGMEIGCHVIGARKLAQKLIQLATIEPSSHLVRLHSLGEPGNDDPMRGVKFYPASVEADSKRDSEALRKIA